MVGFGEAYIPAFAQELGHSDVAVGLTATVPLLVGAIVQLAAPLAVARMGTNRGWVVACTTAQAASFAPFVWWALRGHAGLVELIVAASVYWTAGMAGAPAWNAWMASLVPTRIRTPYFAQRNRLGQFGVLIGFVGAGLLLGWGEQRGIAKATFAAVFVLAALCRLASTALLVACSEPEPPGREQSPATPAGPRQLARALAAMAARPSGALVAFICCFIFGANIAGPYFVPYMRRELGFSYLSFMLVFATAFLAKAIVLPALGRLGSRIGSVRLLWGATLAIGPLSLLWLPSVEVPYLMGVQVIAGCCWAAYELAVTVLLLDAVGDRERTGAIAVYNLGLAVATVAGAACGGALLDWVGTDRTGYAWLFVVSSVLRLAALPLLRRVRLAR